MSRTPKNKTPPAPHQSSIFEMRNTRSRLESERKSENESEDEEPDDFQHTSERANQALNTSQSLSSTEENEDVQTKITTVIKELHFHLQKNTGDFIGEFAPTGQISKYYVADLAQYNGLIDELFKRGIEKYFNLAYIVNADNIYFQKKDIAEIRGEIKALDTKVEALDAKVEALDDKIDRLKASMDRKIDRLTASMDELKALILRRV